MATGKKRKSRGTDWDEVSPISEGKKFDTELDLFSFSENNHTQIRLIGKVFAVKLHWIPTIRKDGTRAQFPKLCLHNNEDAESCPYCKIGLSTNTRYMTNAIIRDLEEARPKKARYDKNAEFKKKGDANWTPVRVVSFPASVMQKILNFKALTKVKTANGIETYHVSHPKYGRDLNVMIDSSGTGSGMYDVQREAVSKLEGEEKEYLLYDIDSVYDAIETEEEAIQVIKSCYDRGTFEGANSRDGRPLVNLSAVQELLGIKKKKKHYDEDEEDDVPSSKKKGKKAKNRYEEDEDLEDEDLEDDEDDDEDEEPRRKSSKKKSSKDEDEDDDLDDDLEDDEDDDEDEEPRRKSSKKKKKSSKDDDEDELLEDEDDDEDEDEEPRRKSSKKKKKSSKDEDEDDDLDDDLDDEDLDDEDEEPRRKSSKKKKKSSKDDDDELLEDDEDEEEERPVKRRKRK